MRSTLQIFRAFDLGTNEKLIGDKIHAAGDNRRIRTLKIRRDCQRTGGEHDLQLVRQQGLHRRRAAFQR